MNLLCFDISSSGVSAAVFNSSLDSIRAADSNWHLEPDDTGAATLSVDVVVASVKSAIAALQIGSMEIDGLCIGTFMHSLVLLDATDNALTPVFTWLDNRGDEGIEYVKTRFGERFHDLTGCRYHPMFPVFKLAAMRVAEPDLLKRARRIVSLKAFLIYKLAGIWVEDHGMAAASGLFDIRQNSWAMEILKILDLDETQFPPVNAPTHIVGRLTSVAATECGLKASVPVIVGSGDGFLANVGSDCEVPSRFAVTLGTSAVVRQTVNRAITDVSAGTFCYRADASRYLLGCAGSNGGNVLDWGRRIFGKLEIENSTDPPIFIPLLHGERSPDWDPHLTGSWHGLTARHTPADLSRSVLEGVIFNLAHFVDIVQTASAETATDLVVSGNGFLHPAAAPMLAAVTGVNTWTPRVPGLASLRGAGVCALRALGQTAPALELAQILPLGDSNLSKRYREYRKLRSGHR